MQVETFNCLSNPARKIIHQLSKADAAVESSQANTMDIASQGDRLLQKVKNEYTD